MRYALTNTVARRRWSISFQAHHRGLRKVAADRRL